MKEITFNEYLEDVLGIDWNYFDNNYGSGEGCITIPSVVGHYTEPINF